MNVDPKKAMIAMSGGVDSSVAALCMQRAGYSCTGVTMKLLNNDAYPELSFAKGCCSLEDSEDARAVCASLGMPFYVFDFMQNFRDTVINDFVEKYALGLTPNPCIVCNRELKFKHLLTRAKQTGFDCLVTGHYANIFYNESTDRWQLAMGKDKDKDQSYVLYAMTQEQLAFTRLPLGSMTKQDVRQMANALKLKTANKPESQDICFIPNGDYVSYISKMQPDLQQSGDILAEDGTVLGKHKGIIGFTIGQRKGIGVAGARPYYVKHINYRNNTIVVATDEHICCKKAILNDINLISVSEQTRPIELYAMHRYRGLLYPVSVYQSDNDELIVTFRDPQKAVTPGQAMVLYNNELVFGGGTIKSAS
ncbi:MAG: tRNA 2-thiouridine(34) synthase MnmA [Coriobacteriales bacterium]|jgi:tRNA-specific 2-thiouridylase|nr:tRNA 2-thiouridine(34) synthase MnmA [Coriobacteriales bacterium]